MRTYSEDLRRRIVANRERGQSAAETARLFGVSKRSVERYFKQKRSSGSLAAKQRGGYRRSRLEGHDATLRQWIRERSDITLGELQERISQEIKLSLGITALWHRLEHLGLSYKKNSTRRRARSS